MISSRYPATDAQKAMANGPTEGKGEGVREREEARGLNRKMPKRTCRDARNFEIASGNGGCSLRVVRVVIFLPPLAPAPAPLS